LEAGRKSQIFLKETDRSILKKTTYSIGLGVNTLTYLMAKVF
jgi:hypothetical protein